MPLAFWDAFREARLGTSSHGSLRESVAGEGEGGRTHRNNIHIIGVLEGGESKEEGNKDYLKK